MKRNFQPFNIFFIFLSFFRVEQTKAQTSDDVLAHEISISKLISYAYENNPEIHAAKQDWKATLEKYRVVTGYPDPQISLTYYPRPVETRVGPKDWNASVSQMIPFPGKLSKAGEIVEADAALSKLKMDKLVRDINTSISQSYHELLYIQEARKTAQHNANLLDELRKLNENKNFSNKDGFSELIKSQTQIAQLSYDIILFDELELTEITKLNGLLNRAPHNTLGQAKPVEIRPLLYSLEELYKLAINNREEIRQALAQIKKAQLEMDLAGYENLPEFEVGFFYAGIGDPDEALSSKDVKEDAYGVQFGMSVPLWFKKNTGRTASARASVQKAKAMKSNLVNQTYTQVRTIYFKLTNAERLITLYEEKILPQALEAVHEAERLFREGRGSLLDFAETQKAAYTFQLSLIRARTDYGKNIAALEQLVGVSLTH